VPVRVRLLFVSTREVAARTEPALHRKLGPIGLLFAGIGSIIGSGWLFGAFNASVIAGPAALLSWAIAGVMVLIIALSYGELGPMFPVAGGVVRYPHLVWGSFTSYSLGWITWISTAAVPAIEVEGALQYATRYAHFTSKHMVSGKPAYTLTGLGLVVAIALLALFVVLNYFGVQLFARINNVLVWWKLAIILVVIVTFFVLAFGGGHGMGSTSNFTSHGFAPASSHGVFIAIATAGITFSFLGFRQGIELAGESDNPRRNIPIAVIGSVLITGAIYVLLQVAFTLGIPRSALSGGWGTLSFSNDFGPLAAISTLAGATWLAYLLYADAIISPADTGLIYTTVSARVSYAMARNRNAPAAFGRTSRNGVPVAGLVLTFVIGLILFLPFPSWQQLVGFITSATVISFGAGPLVVASLRREEPDRHRPFRLPGGDILPFLGFYAANMIIYWGGWDVDKKLFLTVLIGWVLLGAYPAISRGHGERREHFELRSGLWIVPWFGGLALVSWLGDPDKHPHAFNWVFLINLGLSAVIFVLALRSRQPREAIERHLADATAEAGTELAATG